MMDRNDGGPAVDLSTYDASTRMRWYAVMNSWGTPKDLPFAVEPGDDMAHAEYRSVYPRWSAALDAVSKSLTREQQSCGWWRHVLGRSFEEWRDWWTADNRGLRVTINENGEIAERAKERTP